MNLGMIFGSMGASMMKGQFAVVRAPNREYVKGFIGGGIYIFFCLSFYIYTYFDKTVLGGMVIAGACASSGLWRAGEGNTKIWLAIVGFITVNPPAKYALSSPAIRLFLGKGVYIPDVLTWTWTPVFYLAFFIAWYLLAVYNAKTEKFVISF